MTPNELCDALVHHAYVYVHLILCECDGHSLMARIAFSLGTCHVSPVCAPESLSLELEAGNVLQEEPAGCDFLHQVPCVSQASLLGLPTLLCLSQAGN